MKQSYELLLDEGNKKENEEERKYLNQATKFDADADISRYTHILIDNFHFRVQVSSRSRFIIGKQLIFTVRP